MVRVASSQTPKWPPRMLGLKKPQSVIGASLSDPSLLCSRPADRRGLLPRSRALPCLLQTPCASRRELNRSRLVRREYRAETPRGNHSERYDPRRRRSGLPLRSHASPCLLQTPCASRRDLNPSGSSHPQPSAQTLPRLAPLPSPCPLDILRVPARTFVRDLAG